MQLIACRVPKADHDALRCVSKRWRAAAERVGLQRLRATCGWTETALIVAGGGDSVFERGESDPTPDREDCWQLIGGKWRKMRNDPKPRCDSAVVSWRGRVVCVGGTRTVKNEEDAWSMRTGVGDVVSYDAATDEWTDLPAKCERRTSAYAAVDPTTDALVVVGGWRVRGDLLDPDPAINNGHFDEEVGTMQMLANPTDQAWTDLPPMPSAVSNFVGGVIGTKLYVAGGLRWVGGWRIASDELQVFDFETRTWSLGPDLPGPRYYGAGCVCDGRLYIVGGKDESRNLTRSVIVFSPESPAGWSQVSSLPEFRYYHSCCNYKGKLVVFGGEGDGEVFPPLVLSSISGRDPGRHPPEEQLWLSEALRTEILDVLGRALARDVPLEGRVQVGSLNEELTKRTLQRFGFYLAQYGEVFGDELTLQDRELASKLYRRLDDDAAVLSIPPLPAGYDHPLLAAIVCSAPVG
mmetsp:Transcript_11644/g.34615  ORF Transcript_11644/g.34615 Transcript_11644/m.34615 type:complete len:464 (+) Transcript_11644:290-1681(+)